MMRRLIAAVLVVTGSGLLFLGSPAVAADVSATGWWSRTATNDPLSESPQPLPFPNPTTPDTIPIAATVGAGQMLVEGTPDGATAVAAIRWALAEGESSPTLTLPISPGSSVSPASVVLACRAAAPWTPSEPSPGRWESKPVVDGQACINGIVADDVSSIAFGLQPLVRKEVLDIVLIPGRFAEVPQLPIARTDGSSFRWVFDTPTVDSLDTIENSGFIEGAGSVVVSPPPAGPDDPGPVEVPPVTVADSGFAMAAPPTTSMPSSEASPPVSPALDPQEIAAPSSPASLPDLTETGTARTVGMLLLLMGVACAAWAQLSPQPDAGVIGLGRFRRSVVPGADLPPAAAASTHGGLGRFARPRDAPPAPIS